MTHVHNYSCPSHTLAKHHVSSIQCCSYIGSRDEYQLNFSAAVQFTFRQPLYMFFENVGSGQVCVDKSGMTEETIQVRISGGEATVAT